MEQRISTEFESLINDALTKLGDVASEQSSFEHRGSTKRSLDAALLARAAKRRGLHVLRLSEQTQLLTGARRTVGFHQNMPWTLSALDRYVTNDKELTKRVLQVEGLPVARGEVVASVDEALRVHRSLGCPVVVKPIVGSNGRGITVGADTEPELQAAMREALARTRRVLVEECISSIDLRVAVVAGRAVAAMMRVPANVLGDGMSTIEELIARKNAHRAANAYHQFVPIKVTDDTHAQLARYGLPLDAVPDQGRRVFLHYKANLSAGGDSIDITGRIDPGLLRLAETAMKCFGSAHHGGVDILAERFDQPPEAQRSIVCEINCNNDLPIHVFPLFGGSIDVAGLEIDAYCAAAGRRGRPPGTRAGRLGVAVNRGTAILRRVRSSHEDDPGGATLTTTSGWADLPELLASPAEYEGQFEFSSPRGLDTHWLQGALAERGWTDVRESRKLLLARRDGRQIVTERSGRSVFAATVAGRPEVLYPLVREAGPLACRAQRFPAGDTLRIVEYFESATGPWSIRPAGRRQGPRKHSFQRRRTLDQMLAKLSERSVPVLLQQAPDRLALRLLLLQGDVVSSLLLVPVGLVGDGRSPVAELAQARLSARSGHPYLRHLPVRESWFGARTLHTHGLTASTVPDAGQWLPLNRSPLPEAGGEMVGLNGCPVPELAGMARSALEVVGDPPVASVTLAARPADAERGRHWAIAAIDPDPVLAQFAWPMSGSAPGPEVYAAVADVLCAMPRYELSAFI